MSQAPVLRSLGAAALAVLVVAAAAFAYAQTTVTPIPDNAPVQTAPLTDVVEKTTWGDAAKGASLAGTCAACHGLDGNPTDLQYPRLAGQSERYTAQQIALFKSGERNTGMAAIMKPYADMLSAQDARDLGAYFATRESGAGVADDSLVATGPNAGKPFFAVGQQLFQGGDKARGIPACMACHGPDGAGNPGPAYPHVAGQPSAYSQRRLEEYRAGITTRRDPRMFQIMATIASDLTDEEIGSLASYLQGLHPRARDLVAANAPARGVMPAGPVAAPSPAPARPQTTPATVPASDSGADPDSGAERVPAPSTAEPAAEDLVSPAAGS